MIDNLTVLLTGIAVLLVAFRAVRLDRQDRASRRPAGGDGRRRG